MTGRRTSWKRSEKSWQAGHERLLAEQQAELQRIAELPWRKLREMIVRQVEES